MMPSGGIKLEGLEAYAALLQCVIGWRLMDVCRQWPDMPACGNETGNGTFHFGDDAERIN